MQQKQFHTSSAESMNKVFSSILSSLGQIVSFSRLLKNALFRRHIINGCTNKKLMIKAAEEIAFLGLGDINTYIIPGNNCKVLSIKF